MNPADREALASAVEHMGCNCGENQCFTEEEERVAARALATERPAAQQPQTVEDANAALRSTEREPQDAYQTERSRMIREGTWSKPEEREPPLCPYCTTRNGPPMEAQWVCETCGERVSMTEREPTRAPEPVAWRARDEGDEEWTLYECEPTPGVWQQVEALVPVGTAPPTPRAAEGESAALEALEAANGWRDGGAMCRGVHDPYGCSGCAFRAVTDALAARLRGTAAP